MFGGQTHQPAAELTARLVELTPGQPSWSIVDSHRSLPGPGQAPAFLATGMKQDDIEARYHMSRRIEAKEDTLAAAELVIASTSAMSVDATSMALVTV